MAGIFQALLQSRHGEQNQRANDPHLDTELLGTRGCAQFDFGPTIESQGLYRKTRHLDRLSDNLNPESSPISEAAGESALIVVDNVERQGWWLYYCSLASLSAR